MKEEIESMLQQFREIFLADGGDLEVVNIDGLHILLRIVVGSNACPQCIMEPSVVVEILTSNLKQRFHQTYKVDVEVQNLPSALGTVGSH
jgi:Fe-S cluster biogenesis protein NfuA